jgi:hypothetical protein
VEESLGTLEAMLARPERPPKHTMPAAPAAFGELLREIENDLNSILRHEQAAAYAAAGGQDIRGLDVPKLVADLGIADAVAAGHALGELAGRPFPTARERQILQSLAARGWLIPERS